VYGGTGLYTFTLTNSAGGKYSIVGNELLSASLLTLGTDVIQIHADNGSGHVLSLDTTVTVLFGFHPTYYIYGF
jgi:hypothetical protein